MSFEPDWLAAGWRELGQREVAGSRHNARILAFYREVGHSGGGGDEVPWCAAFVGACLERSGHRSTRSLMARSYLRWGERVERPTLGAVAVLSRGRDPALGHVGFLVGWTKDTLWLLGGNQADAVSVASYARDRLLGLRLPAGSKRADLDDFRSHEVEADRTGPDEDGAAKLDEDAVFALALEHVLEMEGGYTNDPHDPGGPTNKGITLATLAAWRKATIDAASRIGLISELKAISDAEVTAIYRERYWRPARCGELAPGLALMHFDAAVNQGPGTAIRILQEAVGTRIDGVIGPLTRAAIAAQPHEASLTRYADIRRRRYRALRHFWRFGRGWLRRVDRTLERSRALAGRSIEARSSPAPVKSVPVKGDEPMTNTTPPPAGKWWGQSMTIWGAFVTAAAAVLPALAQAAGVSIPGELIQEAGANLALVAQAVAALLGTVITIYGRIRATQPLERRNITLKL